MGYLLMLVLLFGGYYAYTDYEASGSMSGRTYYEACWERAHKGGFNEPTPSTPYQAAQWKRCEPVAKRTLFGNGFMFAGLAKDDKDADGIRLREACPDAWNEVPTGGIFYLYVKDTEDAGGVSAIDGVLPASWTLTHWAAKRWPNCSAERERQGYPKLVEKSDGNYRWEKPCAKCAADH